MKCLSQSNNITIQTIDTLQLAEAIHEAVSTHPSVEIASEALKAADAKINLSQSGYYPNFDISASYSRLGPAPSIDIPNLGNFKLYPNDNYAASLNYNQNIYDFGRTSSHVALEKENKEVASENIDVVQQQLTQRVIQTYYSILFLQEALKIKDTQIKTLEDHYEFIKKKQETGSATNYEVLSTQVKLSEIKNQKIDIEAAWQTQTAVMNALLGNLENTSYLVREDVQAKPEALIQDTAVMRALKNRREMQIAVENEKLANMRMKIAKTDYNPVIRAFASAGGKNGYIPDLNKVKLNYVAGIGLSIPLYEGSRNKNNVELAQVSIDDSKYETELTRRKITTEVVNYYLLEQASQKKIDEYELQYEKAEEAYKLAETSYNDGVITNLDLLYASTALAQSQLDLLKSKIDYMVNQYNLRIAMGETIENTAP